MGDRVLVAVIDFEVDASHPDLAGAIIADFDFSAGNERPHAHGTGMAGAIAARRTMLGSPHELDCSPSEHSIPEPILQKEPPSTFSRASIGRSLRGRG